MTDLEIFWKGSKISEVGMSVDCDCFLGRVDHTEGDGIVGLNFH